MDQETEAPLDDVESGQDDDPEDVYLGRSSSGGSIVGSVASSATAQSFVGGHKG